HAFAARTTHAHTVHPPFPTRRSSDLTINIAGTNDAAILSSANVNLTETNLAADISTSGTLTISDVDSPATFVAQAATAGSYGTLARDSARPNSCHLGTAHADFAVSNT